jgi:hemerythrin superfamily protein
MHRQRHFPKPAAPHSLSLFVGGLMAGVVASRLLPPICAMACGAMRVKAGRDPLDALVRDHRHFESLLTAMAAAKDRSPAERGQLFFRLKRRLAAHAMAEEDVVYPMLQSAAEAEQHAKKLYAEHAEMKVLLFRIERALTSSTEWSEPVSRLQNLIIKHARQEETQDFPRLRETLDATQQASLAAKIGREKAMIL